MRSARPNDDKIELRSSAADVSVVLLRQLDLVVLALALPLFALAGLPMLGWGAGAVAWLAQKGAQLALNRKAGASDDPRVVVGLTVGGTIARGWLVAIVIFAAGSSQNSAGLAAAVLLIVLFTIYFTVGLLMRPLRQPDGFVR